MSEHHVEISISLPALQGVPARKLQRLIDIVDFGRSGTGLVTEEEYPRSEFFRFDPSTNTRLSLEEARNATEQWYVLHLLRDALETASTFLEDVRRCCALYKLSAKKTGVVADLQRIDTDSIKFHRLGLPIKLERLKVLYGLDSEFSPFIVSLNDVRNCVVHREGRVTVLDVNVDGHLVATWSRVVLLARSPSGDQEVEIDRETVVDAGWSVAVATRITTKSFAPGQSIEFSFAELNGILWSHVGFVNSLTLSVQKFAESLGFTFAPPTDAV